MIAAGMVTALKEIGTALLTQLRKLLTILLMLSTLLRIVGAATAKTSMMALSETTKTLTQFLISFKRLMKVLQPLHRPLQIFLNLSWLDLDEMSIFLGKEHLLFN